MSNPKRIERMETWVDMMMLADKAKRELYLMYEFYPETVHLLSAEQINGLLSQLTGLVTALQTIRHESNESDIP